jgi:hypothetical protein
MKALFLWRDGMRDQCEVMVPLLPVYRRVIPLPFGPPCATEAATARPSIRTASFRLVRFRDGSFQYNEVAG